MPFIPHGISPPGMYLWLGVYTSNKSLLTLRLLLKVNTRWCQQEGDE